MLRLSKRSRRRVPPNDIFVRGQVARNVPSSPFTITGSSSPRPCSWTEDVGLQAIPLLLSTERQVGVRHRPPPVNDHNSRRSGAAAFPFGRGKNAKSRQMPLPMLPNKADEMTVCGSHLPSAFAVGASWENVASSISDVSYSIMVYISMNPFPFPMRSRSVPLRWFLLRSRPPARA